MEIWPECVPCLLGRVIYEAGLVDPSLEHRALAAALEVMCREYREGVVSVDLATDVHQAAYRAIGSEDPYLEMKKLSNRAARESLPVVERYLEGSGDGMDALRRHLKVAVIGNILDFGISGAAEDPDEIRRDMRHYLDEDPGVDETPRVMEILKASPGGEVIYLTDNAGEIVFDRYLVRYLSEVLGMKVTVVVKGRPMLNDATMEDALECGLDRYAALSTTGSGYVGVDIEALDPDTRALLDRAVLVVVKGMGNFEGLSSTLSRPVLYLMRTKCRPVAESLGAPRDRSVIMFHNGPDTPGRSDG